MVSNDRFWTDFFLYLVEIYSGFSVLLPELELNTFILNDFYDIWLAFWYSLFNVGDLEVLFAKKRSINWWSLKNFRIYEEIWWKIFRNWYEDRFRRWRTCSYWQFLCSFTSYRATLSDIVRKRNFWLWNVLLWWLPACSRQFAWSELSASYYTAWCLEKTIRWCF